MNGPVHYGNNIQRNEHCRRRRTIKQLVKRKKVFAWYACSRRYTNSVYGPGLNTFDNKLFTIYQVDFYHVQAHVVSNISLNFVIAVNNSQQKPKRPFYTNMNTRRGKNRRIIQDSNIIFYVFHALHQRLNPFFDANHWFACRQMCEKLLPVIFSCARIYFGGVAIVWYNTLCV